MLTILRNVEVQIPIHETTYCEMNHLIFPDAPKFSWLSGRYLLISCSTCLRLSPIIKNVIATSGRSRTTLAENAQSGLRCPAADELFKPCSEDNSVPLTPCGDGEHEQVSRVCDLRFHEDVKGIVSNNFILNNEWNRIN